MLYFMGKNMISPQKIVTETVALHKQSKVRRREWKPAVAAKANITPESKTESTASRL